MALARTITKFEKTSIKHTPDMVTHSLSLHVIQEHLNSQLLAQKAGISVLKHFNSRTFPFQLIFFYFKTKYYTFNIKDNNAADSPVSQF